MKVYGEWRRVNSLCINCVVPLESRPVWGEEFFTITGCEVMEYRHTEPNGCRDPRVHSCWNKYLEWKGGKNAN